jgi:hypothetical protein
MPAGVPRLLQELPNAGSNTAGGINGHPLQRRRVLAMDRRAKPSSHARPARPVEARGGGVLSRSRRAPDSMPTCAGSRAGGQRVSQSELYDPAFGRWVPTGSLSTARSEHIAAGRGPHRRPAARRPGHRSGLGGCPELGRACSGDRRAAGGRLGAPGQAVRRSPRRRRSDRGRQRPGSRALRSPRTGQRANRSTLQPSGSWISASR